MNQALPALPKQTASLYSSFIGAADKLALTGGSGLNLTAAALNGMAKLIAPSSTADPSRTAPMSIPVYAVCLDSARRCRFLAGRAGWITVSGPNENSPLLFPFGSPVLPSRQNGRQAS